MSNANARRVAANEAMAVCHSIRSSARKLNLVAATIRGMSAEKAIAELNKSKINIEAGISEHQCWLEQFARFKNVNLITREVIVSLVEKIYIYEENEVEVVFNYRDEFKDIVRFLEKHQNRLRLEVG